MNVFYSNQSINIYQIKWFNSMLDELIEAKKL